MGVKEVDGRRDKLRVSRGVVGKMTTSSTTGRLSPLQHWLEFLASTRSDRRRSTPDEPPTYADVIQAQRDDGTGGWDPRDVWLDRIKRPRDAGRAAALEPVAQDIKESR